MAYFLNINNSIIGPMNAEQVMAYDVDANTPVSMDGMNFAPLYAFPELMEMLHRTNAGTTDTKRVLCGIFAIILGGLGVQYFIMGKVGAGLLTILLSLVTCGLWEIVMLIQGILMLLMSDAEFERKYINSTSVLPLF